MTDPDEASPEFLARLAAGEHHAVAGLYRRHAPVVARVLARTGGHTAEEVEDLVQSTFLEALRSVTRFRGGSSLRTWLLAIALNLSRMSIRRRVRTHRAMVKLQAEPAAVSPADEVASNELQTRLTAALEDLPPLQRETLVLFELEGMSAKDVGELLGVPVATVWRRAHDARVSLRKRLEGGS